MIVEAVIGGGIGAVCFGGGVLLTRVTISNEFTNACKNHPRSMLWEWEAAFSKIHPFKQKKGTK